MRRTRTDKEEDVRMRKRMSRRTERIRRRRKHLNVISVTDFVCLYIKED